LICYSTSTQLEDAAAYQELSGVIPSACARAILEEHQLNFIFHTLRKELHHPAVAVDGTAPLLLMA
jgi:hypothetical protein